MQILKITSFFQYQLNILLDHCVLFYFQKYQLDRVSLHDSKRATYEHTMKCAENLILLGQVCTVQEGSDKFKEKFLYGRGRESDS